jgi:hydrogenase nickel incorporation protein HypB
MEPIKLINIKEEILSDNQNLANELRSQLQDEKVFMVNLMSSPGAGKTSLILETIKRLRMDMRIAVIEGDIESMVDSEKIMAEGVKAVQIRTGGDCHLDAPMIKLALDNLDLKKFDLAIIENVGNLVCPAEFDTGAMLKAMILSVPEGDDKILKYPLMFTVSDVLIINKIDYMDKSDFDLNKLKHRANILNPAVKIFEVSCKTGEGIDAWCDWLTSSIKLYFNK